MGKASSYTTRFQLFPNTHFFSNPQSPYLQAFGPKNFSQYPHSYYSDEFEFSINSIWMYFISEIINGINLNEEIKTIIFVGGYCSNEILINLIKGNLKMNKMFQ